MSGEVWSWQPPVEELVRDLPVASTSASWAREQPDRWERPDGGDVAELLAHRGLLSGSLLWVEGTLQAMLLRDALVGQGHEAARLWDLDGAEHVVLTSRPFGEFGGRRPEAGQHDPVALGGGWLECARCGAGWDEADDEARGRPLVCDPGAVRVGDGGPS